MTEQQKCGETSVHTSWILAKYMKLFIDADTLKLCMLQLVNVLFGNKNEVIKSFRHIPISTSINMRNIERMAKDNYDLLKQDFSTADFYSLA